MIIFYLLGFISSTYQLFPYKQIKKIYNKAQRIYYKQYQKENIFKKCSLPSLEKIPPNSVIFIGHAYGSPRKANHENFIAPKILDFLNKNSKNIKKLIFTGDVFSTPSKAKWDRLETEFKSNFEIHVAPGNHDILRPDSKDVFLQTKYGSLDYPYSINLTTYLTIIDDSISSQWKLSPKTTKKISNSKDKLVLIARHNPPFKELINFTNSLNGLDYNLPKYSEFNKSISTISNLIWIIGDGGAFENMPRIKCLEKDNHKFIINGIGEIKNDTIIVLSDSSLHTYVLK